jgi:hypothetical protein
MGNSADQTPGTEPGDNVKPVSNDEQRFLARLLDALHEQDPAAFDVLLTADPELVDYCSAAGGVGDRIREALTYGRATDTESFSPRTADSTGATPADQRAGSTAVGDGARVKEPEGILTSVTRHLPPARAIELYRKITPVFVFQVLNRLDESASLRVVHELVAHLCSEDVQQRLRESEHVREGILTELREVLGRTSIGRDVSLAELQQLLVDSGAVTDLIAMENCVLLARTQVG